MTPEQQRAVEEFKALRGVEPFGPFIDLLPSPELMTRVSALGEHPYAPYALFMDELVDFGPHRSTCQ